MTSNSETPAATVSTLEEIAEVFSIFHDGGVDGVRPSGSDVEIEIDISYLAKRVDESFSFFLVQLHECTVLRFVPWGEEDGARPSSIVATEPVESLDLEILSATVESEAVHVLCLAHAGGESIRGGVLELSVAALTVLDERRCPMTLAALGEVSDGYWADWRKKTP